MYLGLLSPLLLLTNSSSKHWRGQFRRWIDSSLVQLSCNHWANEGAWWAAVSSWRAANTTIMPSLGGRTYSHVLNEKALHKSDSGLEWKQQLRFWSLCFFAQSCDVTQSIWKENCVCSFLAFVWPLVDWQAQSPCRAACCSVQPRVWKPEDDSSF